MQGKRGGLTEEQPSEWSPFPPHRGGGTRRSLVGGGFTSPPPQAEFQPPHRDDAAHRPSQNAELCTRATRSISCAAHIGDCRILRVLTAIHFDDQPQPYGDEIHIIWTNLHLPPEMKRLEGLRTQQRPHAGLRARHGLPHLPGTFNAHPKPHPPAPPVPPPRWGGKGRHRATPGTLSGAHPSPPGRGTTRSVVGGGFTRCACLPAPYPSRFSAADRSPASSSIAAHGSPFVATIPGSVE
jgi:hypothetical protein